jgi:hypothetical protein
MDEEQDVVGHQSMQRQHFCGEEVRPRQQRQVGPQIAMTCARSQPLVQRR